MMTNFEICIGAQRRGPMETNFEICKGAQRTGLDWVGLGCIGLAWIGFGLD
jgi:hypothetical protein